MPDHTLKAAAGAIFFTLLFFLIVAFQPLTNREVFSPEDASAAALNRNKQVAVSSPVDLVEEPSPDPERPAATQF
jgi:hypothetical protein